jgi:hypothetical protein
MRDGHQAPAGVAAEVSDPAIVGGAVSRRKLGIIGLGFPQQPEAGVEDRLRHLLAIEQLQALLHVHRAEGRALEVGVFQLGLLVAQFLRAPGVDELVTAPQRLVDHFAHSANRSELPLARQPGGLSRDFHILVTVVTDAKPNSPIAIFAFDVFLPQIRRLEDMAVRVDYHRFALH